ncbi:Holliday junction ATP-dependent DNA helicase RuvA [Planctomycetota bacterium]|jgi:Holliday junction DNA helicase RuvA|nr:Holliday junction branch migration protein RuvA [Planctomycetota bacterium]MSR37405.1 Holliday junction branch migration protein RuvA [Planctomycetota bacterium]GDY02614.1 Holliday junction ATP-dependent DNA helicase RuvA [Planctomycetota bacterium]
MYDHLVGEVTEKLSSRVVLRVAGVGYELKVSLTTAAALQTNQQTTLYTILHVVDGTPSLLGFATRSERELARKLLSTSGVGPSTVLSILSVYSPAEVVTAIASSDVAALKRVKGIGQKTAERLCLELRDSVQKLDIGQREPNAALLSQTTEDAVAALITLGYSDKEARDKLTKVQGKLANAQTEELVRAVLQL